MRTEDLILISVDDHIVEPPSLAEYLKDHVPAKYKERVPRVIRRDNGTDAWLIEGQEIASFGLNAGQGRPRESWGSDPASFDQVRPGTFDVHERIRDMNANGMLASMCFPSFPTFTGMKFAELADKNLAAVMLRAYNDWHIDEWCGSYPGRFIPLALPMMWDPKLMAEEVRRVAKKGCHAMSFTESPEKLNFPSFHSDHWDPVWRALSDEELDRAAPISLNADAPLTCQFFIEDHALRHSYHHLARIQEALKPREKEKQR